MASLSFQDKLMLRDNYGIVLCHMRAEDGNPCFHYIKADRANIERMHRDYKEGRQVDFADYGEIVYSGWGTDPTAQEEAMVKELFGE